MSYQLSVAKENAREIAESVEKIMGEPLTPTQLADEVRSIYILAGNIEYRISCHLES